jgi:DNA polymerase-3 subunit alpha
MDHTDKVVTLIMECGEIGLKVLPPDVNHSSYEFAGGGERTIRYGLGAVRGVGRSAVDELLAQRNALGPYKSVEDLCRRLDLQKVNRRVLEALIRSGSLDSLGTSRATLMHRLPAAMQLGDQNSKAHQAGQNDMFGLSADDRAPVVVPLRTPELPEWSEAVRLKGERETLGLYLTGHPISQFEAGLNRFVTHRIGDLISDRPMEPVRFGGGKPVTVAGLIDEVKKRGPRTIVSLDDRTGRLEVTLFEDVFQRYRDLVSKDALVLVEGSLRFDEFSDSWRLSARKITELDKVREQQARRVVLKWPVRPDSAALLSRLAEILTPFRGGPCPVTVEYSGSGARGALNLGPEWAVRASRELLEKLESLVGRGGVQVIYGAAPGGISASFGQ